MFEDKAMAIQINETMLSICTLLNYSISRMEGNTISVKEKKRYVKAVGKIMGCILFEVLSNIWQQYPDLKPKDLYTTLKNNEID